MDDLKFLMADTRARVYALWGVLVTGGFIATHFYQRHAINALWTVIAITGFVFMWRVMPLKVRQMQKIFAAWLAPVLLGLCVAGAVFYVDSIAPLIGHLGAFWLGVMAVGYFLNGLADPPSGLYWFNAVLNAVMAVACWRVAALVPDQYLLAALVTACSMGVLWWFRSRVPF